MTAETEVKFHEGFNNLPTQLVRNGLTLRQRRRTQNAAMYSVGGRGYEVFRVRTQKAWQVKDKEGKIVTIPAAEVYPSNEDFGKNAWYYMPDQAHVAERKFAELSNSPAK